MVLGVGAPYGEATQLYSASVAAANVETELIAVESATRAKPRYIQGVTMRGGNLQLLRMTGPPATFNGQSIHFIGKRDLRTQHVRFDLPVQLLLPFDEELQLFATQDGGVAEIDGAILHYTYRPIPGKPVGFMYSQHSKETVVGSTSHQDMATRKTVALAQGMQTLYGQQISGEGQRVEEINLRSSLWGQQQEDDEQADNGPWAPGANDVFDSDGITKALGVWQLADSRDYIPAVIGLAGDVQIVTYWITEKVPATQAAATP